MTAKRSITLAEVAVITVCFLVASEELLALLPGLAQLPVTAVAAVRLALFASMCVAFGYWIRIRLALEMIDAGTGLVIGVIASFAIRAFRDEADSGLAAGDLIFAVWLVLFNWAALFAGAFWAERRNKLRS